MHHTRNIVASLIILLCITTKDNAGIMYKIKLQPEAACDVVSVAAPPCTCKRNSLSQYPFSVRRKNITSGFPFIRLFRHVWIRLENPSIQACTQNPKGMTVLVLVSWSFRNIQHGNQHSAPFLSVWPTLWLRAELHSGVSVFRFKASQRFKVRIPMARIPWRIPKNPNVISALLYPCTEIVSYNFCHLHYFLRGYVAKPGYSLAKHSSFHKWTPQEEWQTKHWKYKRSTGEL